MCGIAGFVGSNPQDVLLRNMIDALIHRGPDDAGAWIEASCGIALGHRRLSIQDLSAAGHQPMHSACGRYVLVFNGEIYNHLEIRKQLAVESNPSLITSVKSPMQWRGHSDTETLLVACAEWGIEKTLNACVGMFAIALWDKQERVLTLARDRMGEKPLYYGWQGDTFMFASELKALKAHPDFKPEVDRQALTLLLRYNYIPTPFSIYKGIAKLPPGTLLKLSVGSEQFEARELAEPEVYWALADVAERGQADLFAGSDEEALTLLEKTLGDAVEGQQLSDVPLGAFLSGGIDSSLIVSLMKSRSSQPVKTFTIGFEESDYNEAEHAKAVAAHLGTEHSELYVSAQDALDVIPRLPQLYDEPFADSSQIPTFLVAQMAKQHVTVALSGDGGDELFGGYNRHTWCRSIRDKTAILPAVVRHAVGAAMASISVSDWDKLNSSMGQLLPSRYKAAQMGEKIHKVARLLAVESDADMYRSLVSQWLDPASVVMGGSELDILQGADATEDMLPDIEHRMMLMDAITYLPDDILCKVDRAAMAVSLETRVPMLDHRVVELAWKLPLHMKIRQGQGKWILRQLLYKHVPKSMMDRPKQGFGIPLGDWLRGPLRAWAEELLDAKRLINEGFFHPEPIRIKWEEHLSGKRNWQHALWSVLMFQAWLEENR
ncbi:MAG: asparagine synthase (glutamine-hydrolyzing) [Mariprofundus sp.]|nr:asparagine synthase (glutamine-hydrolyzing) [Mariprofundus sp.]